MRKKHKLSTTPKPRKKKATAPTNLADFFFNSPLRGSGVKIERIEGTLRKIDL